MQNVKTGSVNDRLRLNGPVARTTWGVLPLLILAAATVGRADWGQLADNTWTRIANCPGDALRRDVPPGRGATWVYEPVTGTMLRYGGYTPSDSNALDAFDPESKTWRRLFAHDENYPTNRPGGGSNWMMAYDAAVEKVLLAVGWATTANTGDTGVWQYDPATQTFSKIGAGLNFRTYLVWDPVRRQIVASPGIPAWGGHAKRTLVFDVALGVWEAKTTEPLPQSYYSGGHPAIYDPSVGKIVLIKDDETWHYDTAEHAWEKMSTTGTPPKKKFPAMAFDPEHQALLRYGGSDGRQHFHFRFQNEIVAGKNGRGRTRQTRDPCRQSGLGSILARVSLLQQGQNASVSAREQHLDRSATVRFASGPRNQDGPGLRQQKRHSAASRRL